jgi:hypothetical protein
VREAVRRHLQVAHGVRQARGVRLRRRARLLHQHVSGETQWGDTVGRHSGETQ